MLTPGKSMGGRYRLDERIATGGMGDVWKCEDTVLGRAVALKVLQPAMLEEPGFAERFRAEARVMATINHPGVVQVYDYGENGLEGGGTVAYLVMEYVEGEPLHQVLGNVGRLAPARVMDLTAQAADALQAAHDRGIIHRDVKPGNLLMRPNGKLVLTDFGIARSAMTGNLTQVGAVLGTASYVSPEQATGTGDITPASDIYSLGVVAYQCLAGRRPFEGENPIEVAMKHVRDEPPPLPQDVPDPARAVVSRAMAKDMAARWPDARSMGEAAREAAA
ncbi:MAG: serine/threonine-protein kinase, partial [Micromonosporaceae bacterium]